MGKRSALLEDVGGVSTASRLGEHYVRHAQSATQLAYLLTGDRGAAEDLVQDAFVRIYSRLGHLRKDDAFSPYLRKTVLNLSRQYFRRRKVHAAFLERWGPTSATDTKQPDVTTQDALRGELIRLPYRQRAAIVLRFYEDLSDDQTAELLGCSRSTVRSLISRGIDRLRAEMTDE